MAAGHVAAAIGTQTNGSVVRPAAYCGVVGFKPTVNAIPVAGVHEFSVTFDTVGTFGRRVADAARLAGVIADPGRIAPAVAPLAAAPRLGFVAAFPWVRHDPDASAVVATAVARLRGHAEIVPLAIPERWRDANVLLRTIMLHEAGVALAALQARERARLTPALNAALDEGRTMPVPAYRAALAQRDEAIAFFTEWLSGFDAVLAPSAPGTAPFGLATTGDPSCCTLWSLLGFPALNLPCGKLGRMPIGLQFAAPQGCDNRLLSVASLGELRLPFEGLV